MTTVLATKVYLTGGTFSNCKNITSVNCHNTPFVNNTAAFGYNGAFANCSNLTNVSGLNSKTNSLYQSANKSSREFYVKKVLDKQLNV